MRVLFYLIELRKHLDRSEDKLKSARILLEIIKLQIPLEKLIIP